MCQGTALGGIALAVDTIQTRSRPKLKSVEAGSVEGFYLLATYVFDLARKLEYVYKATRQFTLEADPALAAEIKQDNVALEEFAGRWKQAAEKAEEIVLRLYGQIGEEHEALLNIVASRRR